MRSDGDVFAERYLAFENATDIERYVAAADERTAHIDACRVGEAHSGVEKCVRLDALIAALELGEIALAVDAQRFGDACSARCRHRHAVAHRERNHVGQEIFAARIAIVDRRQPAREGRGRRRHDAGVDFADRLLLESRLLVLDDGGHPSVRGANDAAISRRIVEVDREQRQGAPPRVLDDFTQCRFARQRIRAEQHQRHAVGRERGKRAAQRVARAARRILPSPDKIGIGKTLAYGVAGALDDEDHARDHGPRGCEHMRQQGLPAERMQNLGQRGVHPLAFPRGENGDLQRQFLRRANYRIFVPWRTLPRCAAGLGVRHLCENADRSRRGSGPSRGGASMQTRITLAVGLAMLLLSLGAYAADDCKHRGELDTMYCDDNNDLVADAPADPKKWKNPSTIVFTYTPVEDPAVYENIFKPFTTYLAKCVDKKVVFYQVQSNAAEIEAMRSGRLHVAGFSTGPTAFAVNLAGAIPFAVKGTAKEFQGYNLIVIVKANSPYQKLADLKGKKVAHTSPSSNSGHLAPLALFPKESLIPDKDYKISFSGKQDQAGTGGNSGGDDACGVPCHV